MRAVSFIGRSGQGYGFKGVRADAPWARQAGVAIFAARGGYGRRIVKVVELSGKAHDIQPIWALAEAERYGATEVFVCTEHSAEARRAMREDLETGLSPACPMSKPQSTEPMVAAAA